MAKIGTAVAVAGVLALTSCVERIAAPPAGQVQVPEGTVLFEVAKGGERFRVAVADAGVVERLQALLDAGEPASVLIGDLRAGDGGFNSPYDWHLDPPAVQVADVSVELCDGLPSHVQDNLQYWLETVKQFCPWGVEILAEK